jgi:Type VI secretion system (T6SS), amidase immunity protein
MTLLLRRAALSLAMAFLPLSTFASDISKLTQTSILKNWVLSRCISKAYSSAETKADAEASAAAYLEFSKLPIEAFNRGDVLVEEFLAKKYGGSVASPYNTLKCIDLFQSKELDALVKKHLPKV